MARYARFAFAATVWLAAIGLARAQEPNASAPSASHDAIEFSPASPFIRIYAVQYAHRLTDRDEILAGGAYTNIKYDFGRSHAPTSSLAIAVTSGETRTSSISFGRRTTGSTKQTNAVTTTVSNSGMNSDRATPSTSTWVRRLSSSMRST
jgi:hypothetical protein